MSHGVVHLSLNLLFPMYSLRSGPAEPRQRHNGWFRPVHRPTESGIGAHF